MSKFKHLLFFIIFSVVTNFAFSQLISVPFDDGFIGTRGNNAQDADLIKTFTTLGINKSSFIQQTPNGAFVTSVQGNDIPGTLRLYFSSPKSVTISGVSSTKSYVDIAGSIVWRNTTGSTVNYFGFLPDLNTNISFLYSTNLTFNITRPTSTTGSNIGNLRVDRNFTFTDNTSQSGNAAGVLDDLNSYRLTVQSLDPSGPVTVNSLTTSNQNPTITGNATLNSGESLTVTVNGVVYSVGDGNLSISGNSWSLVIPNSNLLPYATYSVEAIITNSSGYILTDLTSNELVITPPTLTTSGTLKTFTTCSGCVISPQSFTVSGSGLSSDLIVTAPTGVEVSTISNASYSSTVTLTPNSGTVSSTTVYVRLTNNSTAANSGVISVTTTGATSKTVSVTTNTDNGLNFDGVNDNVRLPISVANGLTNFTFEAWVNPSIQNTFRRLFDFGIDVNKYMLFTIHNGKPFFAISNGTYPQLLSNTTIPLNTWTHLAVVINDATDIATIYINGHADVSGSMPFNPSSLGTISAAYLGTGFYAENFGGKMDEVRIWNTARTSSEIANNYLKELVGNETGLQAYYNFNQGVANGTNTGLTTLYDKTSAARNSTSFNNFALTGSISNYVDGFIPSITEANNSSNVAPGYTLQLTNALTGGIWSSTNTNFATVNTSTGLVTGIANGTLSITYSICGKTTAYTLNVVSPTISTSGTLKTFTTCSGCTVMPQSFTVSGSYLGSSITVAAPTGVEVSTFSNTSYASTISITPTSGTISSTTVYVRLINSALSANSGVISVTADGATSQTVTLTTNTDNALDFDGNDYVDIPDDNKLDFTTSFTIEGWVYPKTANATQVVFGKVNDLGSGNGDDVAYMLRLNNGKFQIEVGNGTVPSKYYAVNNYDQNKWQHVAMVYSLGTLSFYFNGVLQASHSTGYANNSILTTSSSFKFGVYKPAFAQYFNGTLDNFRLWNVARTQSEISANMNSEIMGTVPGLVASYTFNNGIGNGNNTSISNNNAIEDFTNNNLNGNLVGFAKNGTTSNFVSGFIPNITATGNASSVPAGNTLQLSNALSGGTWSSTNTNLATVDANTGLVTGLASGTLSISYTVCDKTVSYALTVVMPTISTNGTLYTFSTCSGCNVTPQSFSVSGTNLGTAITVTAPTGFVVSNASNGTYSSTLSLSPTNGTLTSTSVYVKLTNNAVSANSGVISITSSGATNQSIAVNTNTDNALSFDGSDAINIGQPIAAGSSYTIEAWINYKGSMTENNILSSTGNVFWIYQDKLNAGFTGNFQVVTSPNVLEKNKWNHVAVTLDDPQNLMNLYINGNLVASASTNLSFNGGENLYIGSHYVSNNTVSYFNGDIDEVRVWNTARTLAQIQNNMYKELVGFNEPNLRAYYNFNDGIIAGTNNGITNLTDASLTAYNYASLSSFTLAGNTSNFVPGYIPAITGTANANIGATSTLSNTLTGGTWSSSNTNIATINSSTGVVTAVAAGSSTITYSICDKIVNTIFTVNVAPPASLSYTTPNVYPVGSAITSLNPTNTGGTITTYSIGPSLPAGLTIDPTTGVISGTPSAVSSQTSYTVTGTNASGTVTATVVITVNEPVGAPVVQTQTEYCVENQVSEYKYAKVVFSALKNFSFANSIQVAEWKWFNGNTEISRTGVTVTNPGDPSGETPSMIYDGSTSSKWLDFNIKSGDNTSTLIFTFPGAGYRITSYSWVTANDAEERDPKSWTVYMSNDNINWTQVHTIANYPATANRGTTTFKWNYANASSAVTLTATAVSGYSLRWYTTASAGTATTTAPTLNTSSANTVTHYVSQYNSGYESPRAVLTVNVNALPVAPTVATVNYTVGATASTLTATALSNHSLKWYTVASGGTATTTAPTPSTTSAGTINYYVSQINSATGCEGPRAILSVETAAMPQLQPQGSLNAVDYGLLATDTVKLKLTTSNGVAPFTLILSNNNTTTKDTISNLTPVNNVVTFLQKRLDTTKVFTIYKLIDANNNVRSSGFTKDTTIVNVLKPKILLTLKAEPTIKQADNSFKTRLLLKVKNSGDLDLRNVQVNANLSSVFPVGINYVLDSVRVLAGNFSLNPNYTGAGTATSASSTYFTATSSSNGSKKSLATLDQNYLFNNGVSLNKDEEGEIVYYVSIGATTQNVTLKLQFETAGDGVLVKNDGTSSAQETTSKSDDGTNIAQHPDVTNQGLPMPTYVPLFPNEKIGGSLAVSSATAVTGGYQYHFIAKIKNYGNVNLDSIRIQYNFNNMYPAPDQASLIGIPTITRGNIVYNTNVYDGYNDVNLFKYGGDLQVGDSATYEYDLKVTTNKTAYTWPNYFVVYGRSINSGVFINDTSMSGSNPDPNNDNDPAEQFFTKVTINFTPPAPPTVENKTYVYGTTKPANIGGLVKSTPVGTIPVWCDQKTAACSIIPPATPTEIGKYIYALRSYDTTTLLYSEVLVYDTVIIKPPVPIVINKKYIIGNTSNPANVSNQVTGMSGSVLNYFKNASLQSVIPTLGTVPGVTRYTTSQTVNGIESDTVGFTVTMLDPKTMLHLRKIADEPKLQSNSTFNITYTFIVTNRTDEVMTNVLVADNLQNTFPSPTLFDVVSVSSTGGLVFNNAFNGKTDIQLLKATSSLAAAAIDTIRLTVNLQPKGYSGTVNNAAVITATTPYGNLSINSSSTSFANETVKSPTPAVIPDLAIDIPEAFSPNRDGVNDRFVILKPFGTTLELEVYNRWGNVVYYNANYNNEWDGRGTNNFIGQDLMDGGYYYTLKAKSVTGNSQIFKGFVLIQR